MQYSDFRLGSCEPVPEQTGIYRIIQCDFLTKKPITRFQFSDDLFTNFEIAIKSNDYFLATVHNTTSCDDQGSDMAMLLDHCFPLGETASIFATRNGKTNAIHLFTVLGSCMLLLTVVCMFLGAEEVSVNFINGTCAQYSAHHAHATKFLLPSSSASVQGTNCHPFAFVGNHISVTATTSGANVAALLPPTGLIRTQAVVDSIPALVTLAPLPNLHCTVSNASLQTSVQSYCDHGKSFPVFTGRNRPYIRT
jgi:hypothetical protein